jgi:hypothetical protein
MNIVAMYGCQSVDFEGSEEKCRLSIRKVSE